MDVRKLYTDAVKTSRVEVGRGQTASNDPVLSPEQMEERRIAAIHRVRAREDMGRRRAAREARLG